MICSEDCDNSDVRNVVRKARMNRGSSGFFLLANFVCVFLTGLSGLASQTKVHVGDIEFRGVSVFSAEDVLRTFSQKKGSPFQQSVFNDDLDRLKTLYADSGYYYARVDSVSTRLSSDTADMRIYVFEGKQSMVDSIGFVGNASISGTKLGQSLAFRTGFPFIRTVVEQGAQVILRSYENAG